MNWGGYRHHGCGQRRTCLTRHRTPTGIFFYIDSWDRAPKNYKKILGNHIHDLSHPSMNLGCRKV